MLSEIRDVKQEPEAGYRRWFESDGFDLVVWYGADRAVTGFQICYDLGRGEHALTWRHEAGFSHGRIDSGDGDPLRNECPIVVPDGAVPWPELRREYERRSLRLDPAIREFVAARLLRQG